MCSQYSKYTYKKTNKVQALKSQTDTVICNKVAMLTRVENDKAILLDDWMRAYNHEAKVQFTK